ncbi:ankyrin repeat domain-containing protein [Nocardia sp. CA-107356]|uniref:ankyrin repeat domain-containing protein n=1 Tax=Nocardia sp. CA-107356 TaxID=3239972 RepID=UPI003D93D89C
MAIVFADPMGARVAEAIGHGDYARVAQLIQDGADPDAVGTGGVSLLGWAILNRSAEAVWVLLNAGADTGRPDDAGDTAVHYAAVAEDPRYLGAMLARQANVDLVNPQTGHTPLMSAVLSGRRPQMHMLLTAGACPDATDRAGDTPLHLAAEIGDYRSVVDLLAAGADPTRTNARGSTFHRTLLLTPPESLTARARRDRDRIIDWLHTHDIPVEGS